METLAVNITGKTRREELNGRKYIVAPLSLIVPGVLNGSEGPLLYPLDEVKKSTHAWNGMPIVENHPTVNGRPVSARNPEVYQKSFLGYVFNSHTDEKLSAEGWFDIEKTREVNPSILNRIENGEQIELSTGLLPDIEPAPKGENIFVNAKGEPKEYTGITRNYRPDHLAILPNDRGACSLSDGCGVMVNQAPKGLFKKLWDYLVANEMSHGETMYSLQRQLQDRFANNSSNGMESVYPYIDEVFDDYVIYNLDGKHYRLDYTQTSNKAILSEDEPVEVIKQTSFVSVTNEEQNPMTNEKKQGLVEKLVANCGDCESHRETLEALPESILQMMLPQEPVANQGQPEGEQKTEEEQVVNKQPLKLEDLDPTLQAALQTVLNQESSKKQDVITKLTANIKGDEQKQLLVSNLEKLDLAALQAMLDAQPKPHAVRFPGNFGGEQPTPVSNSNPEADEDDIAAMTANVINYADLAQERA